ncbi:uncharacterized protein LOC111262591 isoform X4 [Varroa jacobsoni]|uniref:uncharacterized protein LOC111262591 isoform X4 n=1 Tax=Varroa jacobsoni TaxID=62625 RepID=UPI000BF5CD98|nr:uncharacterized protein LOC111262591 isoform X4 [Varroa jacobsoni]
MLQSRRASIRCHQPRTRPRRWWYPCLLGISFCSNPTKMRITQMRPFAAPRFVFAAPPVPSRHLLAPCPRLGVQVASRRRPPSNAIRAACSVTTWMTSSNIRTPSAETLLTLVSYCRSSPASKTRSGAGGFNSVTN